MTITDANASITALQVTITGTLAVGDLSQTEVSTVIVAGSTDLNEAWAHIDSITVDSVTGGTSDDKLDVGWGNKFGLGNEITASSDIVKINEDETDTGVDDATISTTYNTIQFETAPDGAIDYSVWYITD